MNSSTFELGLKEAIDPVYTLKNCSTSFNPRLCCPVEMPVLTCLKINRFLSLGELRREENGRKEKGRSGAEASGLQADKI